jgi:hypothetical protein
MNPITQTSELFQRIPVKIRDTIYGVLATAFAVETALDLAGWGFVESGVQAKVALVLGALGFGIAKSNTKVA